MPHRFARLLHPAFLLALATLLVNDHILKEAIPSVLTGKLSDIAGLIVLPVLLTTVLRIESRQLVWAIHLAVGGVFAAIQFVPAETLWSLTVLPLRHTPDSTDLIALAILPLGVRLSLVKVRQLDLRMRPVWANAVGLVAVGAVLATSPPQAPLVVEAVPVVRSSTPIGALDTLEIRLSALGYEVGAPRVLPYDEWLARQSSWEDGEEARARHAEVSAMIQEGRDIGELQYRVAVPPGSCPAAPDSGGIGLDLLTWWDPSANELAATIQSVEVGEVNWQFADEAERTEGRRLVTACIIQPLQSADAASR